MKSNKIQTEQSTNITKYKNNKIKNDKKQKGQNKNRHNANRTE